MNVAKSCSSERVMQFVLAEEVKSIHGYIVTDPGRKSLPKRDVAVPLCRGARGLAQDELSARAQGLPGFDKQTSLRIGRPIMEHIQKKNGVACRRVPRQQIGAFKAHAIMTRCSALGDPDFFFIVIHTEQLPVGAAISQPMRGHAVSTPEIENEPVPGDVLIERGKQRVTAHFPVDELFDPFVLIPVEPPDFAAKDCRRIEPIQLSLQRGAHQRFTMLHQGARAEGVIKVFRRDSRQGAHNGPV